uniref:Uncharacterized protein n=1 Tax=Tanacetum cinerariifolium TaxID=118510 RepID=A0A699K7W3_TANCI|nr:hypothetical protein [Tanacetum cinerariifolium]
MWRRSRRHVPRALQWKSGIIICHTPDRAWTEYVSGGMTLLSISSTKHKERPLRKFLTSLAPEWLMYTIMWRNKDDLDIMSLDDVYNHLKVYEPKVQKKSESNSQNMAFISSSNTISGKGKVHTAIVSTASVQVSTASTDVATASLSHDTVCAYIAFQSNGS